MTLSDYIFLRESQFTGVHTVYVELRGGIVQQCLCGM